MPLNMKKDQFVVPHSDGWAVRGSGNAKLTRIVSTQKEAIQIARQIAINQESELSIQGSDGRIREKNSYGKDPYPPKG